MEEFLNYISQQRRYSQRTTEAYKRDLEAFVLWACADKKLKPQEFDPKSITQNDVRNWITHLSDIKHTYKKGDGKRGRQCKELSTATINRMLSALKSYFKYLQRTQKIEHNPARGVKCLKQSSRLPSFVREERLDAIYGDEQRRESENFIELRNDLIMEILYECGIRLAELVGLDIDDFNPNSRSLLVEGKGDKQRVIPITAQLSEKILYYISVIKGQKICRFDKKALILTQKGDRISRITVYRIVRDRLERADSQSKHSPHVLRHTFATLLLSNGADIREIQELLGHESLRSTQVYTHNTIGELQRAYAKAHPREKR